MGLLSLLLIAIGLSMDAFAVSICHGLSMKKTGLKNAVVVGLYFGIFQAGMPLIGYSIGYRFSGVVEAYDHWIAFVLLAALGIKMIGESKKREGCPDRVCPSETCADRECPNGVKPSAEKASLKPEKMIPLAVATSIDAFAVGISFAFMRVDIIPAVVFIGMITLVLSMLGVKIGAIFGTKYKAKAELAGGVILIFMGAKILLEHLGVLVF